MANNSGKHETLIDQHLLSILDISEVERGAERT